MNDGKILIAAHLEMCQKCNLHGVIVYSDKSRSERLDSQEEAVVEMERAREAGLLMAPEITELRRQISELLPPQDVADALGYAESELEAAEESLSRSHRL